MCSHYSTPWQLALSLLVSFTGMAYNRRATPGMYMYILPHCSRMFSHNNEQQWSTSCVLRWLGRVIHCKFPLHPLLLPISILHISIAHFHSAYTVATNCACAVSDGLKRCALVEMVVRDRIYFEQGFSYRLILCFLVVNACPYACQQLLQR